MCPVDNKEDFKKLILPELEHTTKTYSPVTTQKNLVVMIGYSTCSHKPLSGTNIWAAKIRGKRASEWRVDWLNRK